MIPTKLMLHNFMCYRDPVTLDLSTTRVACIAGDNGAGKSTLLDAITWVLWGKARTATERDLLTLGATEMSVEYQFLMGQQEYRVMRRRRRRGKSPDIVQLDVQLRDSTPDGDTPWRPITGDTVAHTQRLLTKAIGMEYDTFINSAFILQGRADEFTNKGPTDRKQVLADILGLGRYDELEERARALRRDRESAREDADRELGRIHTELETRPERERELAGVTAQLLMLGPEVDRLGEEVNALEVRRAELELHAAQTHAAEMRRDEHAREADRLRLRIVATQQRVTRLEATLAQAEAIRAGYAELHIIARRHDQLNAALSQLHSLDRQLHKAEQRLEAARSLLLQEQHALEHQLTGLTAKQEQLPQLEAQHQHLSAEVAALNVQEERQATFREALTSATGEIARWKAENAGLKREMDQLKDRQQQIDSAEATCPLCRRPLDDTEHRRIHDDYQAAGVKLGNQFRANKQQIVKLERDIAGYQEQLQTLGKTLRGQRSLATQLGIAEQQLTEARDANNLSVVITAERDRYVERLARGDYGHESRAEITALNAEIAALAYDADEHQRVRDRHKELAPFDRQWRDLDEAESSIEQTRHDLADDQAALARREADHAAETVRVAALRAASDELPALLEQYEDTRIAYEQKTRQQAELHSQHGGLRAQLQRLADREEQGRQLRLERARLAEEAEIYKQLSEAFGKRGIQAMIIEAAVPELQDEANAILANMPGTSMRVEFRTQRETQKGDIVEALDIVIGDEAGQRNYVMFSGGEAFRVNFAIRVALSKLLARRAGAKLQTLVIDEGFGTQDARGRDGIVEAIRSIEDDFQTILIVTHLNDLKDAFPTQIFVEKTPTGSRVSVN